MALAVCGNVDVKRVEEICDEVLKEAPKQIIVRDYECDDEPKEVYQKRSSCNLAVAKPILAIGIKDSNISSDNNERAKKFYAMQILNEILYSRTGELYNTLYDKNLISHALDYAFEHDEFYSFNQISTESSNPESVYEHFVEFIESTKKKGLDKEEFELSKRTIYASYIKSFDSTEEIAENIMSNHLEETDLFDIPEIISSISYEYVAELLNEFYKEEYYAMSVVNPISKSEEEM
jgi:predicted Zn-dependent peptidase